jgi:aspartate/methionine/tyrosine aminotransferase
MTTYRDLRPQKFDIRSIFGAAQQLKAANLPYDDLSLGQPGAISPIAAKLDEPHILKRRNELLSKYGPSVGEPELRQGVACYISETLGIPVSPENIQVTDGGSLAMFLVAQSLSPINNTTLPAPLFENSLSSLRKQGHTPYMPHVTNSEELVDTLAAKRDLHNIILTSPNNPTGTLIPEGHLAEIYESHPSSLFFEDLAYLGIGRSGGTHSMAKSNKNTLMLFSGSKVLSSAGARIGAIVMPDGASDGIRKVFDNSTQLARCAHPTINRLMQVAAGEVLTDEARGNFPHRAELNDLYGSRVEALTKVFTDAGYSLPYGTPEGAFYIMIGENEGEEAKSSKELFFKLWDMGVVSVPGDSFEAKLPSVRLSAANWDVSNAKALAERLA